MRRKKKKKKRQYQRGQVNFEGKKKELYKHWEKKKQHSRFKYRLEKQTVRKSFEEKDNNGLLIGKTEFEELGKNNL